MTEFIIDRKIWRCGNNSSYPENRLGIGNTRLLNEEGCFCILGQCCRQLTNLPFLNLSSPEDILICFEQENCTEFVTFDENHIFTDKYNADLPFTRLAIKINDSELTTVKEKEENLTELFLENNIILKFIN